VPLSPCDRDQRCLWGSVQLLLRRSTGHCVSNHAEERATSNTFMVAVV
jgi:hypothetical protein